MKSDLERIKLEVMHLWTCNKVIFRTGIPIYCLNKENKYDRKDNFQQNPVVFLAVTHTEKKNFSMLCRKMQKYFSNSLFIASAGTSFKKNKKKTVLFLV